MNSFLTPMVYTDQYYSCNIFTKVIKSGFLAPVVWRFQFILLL